MSARIRILPSDGKISQRTIYTAAQVAFLRTEANLPILETEALIQIGHTCGYSSPQAVLELWLGWQREDDLKRTFRRPDQPRAFSWPSVLCKRWGLPRPPRPGLWPYPTMSIEDLLRWARE